MRSPRLGSQSLSEGALVPSLWVLLDACRSSDKMPKFFILLLKRRKRLKFLYTNRLKVTRIRLSNLKSRYFQPISIFLIWYFQSMFEVFPLLFPASLAGYESKYQELILWSDVPSVLLLLSDSHPSSVKFLRMTSCRFRTPTPPHLFVTEIKTTHMSF